MPGSLILAGQLRMKGVEIPPSCVQRLNLRNGVLEAFAHGRS